MCAEFTCAERRAGRFCISAKLSVASSRLGRGPRASSSAHVRKSMSL
eukprot:CAMPEP_0176271500 /NCGR_PEP_ID=MMETSP0121_2-20121125/45236_1 /TAXON_ID=160619 /ORGANISM="Kryptoperidinium foliaceum, Strain CCMP 1326" /LENGTH=46 /DNA_ID= /DNA_START= /DNA_END= /DNA_ORIENTATION=